MKCYLLYWLGLILSDCLAFYIMKNSEESSVGENAVTDWSQCKQREKQNRCSVEGTPDIAQGCRERRSPVKAGSWIKIPQPISGKMGRIISSSSFGAHCEFSHICSWKVDILKLEGRKSFCVNMNYSFF